MRYSSAIAASAALVAGANAWDNVTYTTEIVTAYTTYCPSATVISHGTHTYTVTEATTLTITNCPCTVTKPVFTSPVVYCPTCASSTPIVPVITPVVSTSAVASSVPVKTSNYQIETTIPVVTVPVPTGTELPSSAPVASSAPVVPVPTTGVPVPNGPVTTPIFVNSTVPAPISTRVPAPSGSVPGTTKPAAFQGAANKAYAASAASLASLLGLAALLL